MAGGGAAPAASAAPAVRAKRSFAQLAARSRGRPLGAID
jgi:hypothetical protein